MGSSANDYYDDDNWVYGKYDPYEADRIRKKAKETKCNKCGKEKELKEYNGMKLCRYCAFEEGHLV